MKGVNRPAWVLYVLAIALLLLVQIVLPSSLEGTGAETQQYNESAIFQPGTVFSNHSLSYAMPSEVRDMVLGDMNSDGVTDVIVANKTSIFVFYGKGDGGLITTPSILTKSGMRDVRKIAVGDLDGDLKDDVAVTYTDNGGTNPRVTLFFQAPIFGTSLDISTYPEPYQIAIGRFDNSANNGLAIACKGNPSIGANITLLQYPFRDAWNVAYIKVPEFTNFQLLTAGYDNADGRIDLIAGNMGGPNVYVFDQPATFSGSWTSRRIDIGGALTDIRMVNNTGHGLQDLAVMNTGYQRVEFRNNNGGISGSASQVLSQSAGAATISFGLVAGTTLPDLIVTSFTSGDCRFFPRQGTTFDGDVYTRFPLNVNPIKALPTDHGLSTKGIYVLSQSLGGTAPLLEFYPWSSSGIGNADVNLPVDGGKPSTVIAGNVSFDIVASIVQNQNRVFVSNLAGTATALLPTGSKPGGLFIGDLNGDETGDLAILNQDSDTVSIYFGSTNFLSKIAPDDAVTLGLSQPQSIAGGRISSIDAPILVIGGRNGIEVVYGPFSASSNEISEQIATGQVADRAEVFLGAFKDPARRSDIATFNKSTGRIDLFFQKVSGIVGDCYYADSSAWLNMMLYSPTSATVGDFDGNRLDDVAVSTQTGVLRIFFNNGNFIPDTSPSSLMLDLTGTVRQLRSADLNDDGFSDLAVSYEVRPAIALYFSRAGTSFVNPVNFTAGGPSNGTFAGDVNGDGRADLLASSSSSPFVSYWLQHNLRPVAKAWLSSYTVTEGNPAGIRFDSTNSTDSFSDNKTLQRYWNFGDGGTSTYPVVQYAYLNSGTYNGFLLVTDLGGLSDRIDFKIFVADIAPVANFSFESDNAPENALIWFNDTSDHYDDITSWDWDFDDGTHAFTQDTTHRFMQNRTYHVSLTITEADGNRSTFARDVHVADRSPNAKIIASPTTIDENGTVTFQDASTSYPDTIGSYEWDFKDGSPKKYTKVVEPHRFTVDGTYEVTLTIIDSDGSVSVDTVTITVRDIKPVASFSPSKTDPLEGESITLTDHSSSYDGIVSWRWELGDGRELTTRNATISYQNSGTYAVTLTVTEDDGNTSSKSVNIIVRPTSPSLGPISAVGSGTLLLMDESISFNVPATPALVPIVRIEWDLDFNTSKGFTVAPGMTENHTSWTFREPRTYIICVRVWDSNSYSEKNLTITIHNVYPHVVVTAQENEPGKYSFDASLCWDTPSDNESLEFRWNFGDSSGWGEWTSNVLAWKNYTVDGRYTVTLEVRDQWDGKTSKPLTVVADRGAPVIQFDNSSIMTQAYLGDNIDIKVNVTDVSEIAMVKLFYMLDGVEHSITMSRIAGTDIYVATIPALNVTGTLEFHIEAQDAGGYSSVSGTKGLTIIERPNELMTYMILMALATIVAVLLIYLYVAKMVVDEVFIIYEDGNLIAHQTRRLKPGMDDQILGSMLVAIQNFVRDSFKDEGSTGLNRMDFGEKKVLVERGDHIYLAVVLHGKREGKVPQRMRDTIARAEEDFKDALSGWDGDLEKVRGIKDRTSTLVKGSIMDALPSVLSKAEEPVDLANTTECPICDARIGLDEVQCPQCGADLGMAGIKELADIADEIRKDQR